MMDVELHSLCLDNGFCLSASTLSEAERRRMAFFRSENSRRLFVAGRQLCREVLGRITGCTPESLQIEVSTTGKPFLPDYPEIHFNLSHSGAVVLAAFSQHGPVGVDVEHISAAAASEFGEEYRLVLSDGEFMELMRLSAKDRPPAFLTSWVSKEAALKCLGSGLRTDPRRIVLRRRESDDTIPSGADNGLSISAGLCISGNGDHLAWAIATAFPHDETSIRDCLDLTKRNGGNHDRMVSEQYLSFASILS